MKTPRPNLDWILTFTIFGVVNYESELRISKFKIYRIQYGHLAYNIFVNSLFFSLEKSYSGVCGVGDDDFEVRL